MAKSGSLKVNLTSDNREKFLGTKASESSQDLGQLILFLVREPIVTLK